MWRFFIFPLVTGIAVLVESALYLCLLITSWFSLALLLPQSWSFRPITLTMYREAIINWVFSDALASRWPSLVGAGVLIGLGVAGCEFVRSRTGARGRNVWALVQNIFWFGLYVLLLTTPFICAILAWSQPNRSYRQSIGLVLNNILPWSGFAMVFLAGVHFVNSNRVFSPKTVVQRIKHGRLHASES